MQDYPIHIIRDELQLQRGECIDKEIEYLGELSELAETDHYNAMRRKMRRIQTDEVCFGRKKDGRGCHGRAELEWYMSTVEVDENGKTTDFFMEQCPDNKRSAAEVTWHVERLAG